MLEMENQARKEKVSCRDYKVGGRKSMQISDIWTASVLATMLTAGNEYLKRHNERQMKRQR